MFMKEGWGGPLGLERTGICIFSPPPRYSKLVMCPPAAHSSLQPWFLVCLQQPHVPRLR